MLQLRSFVVGLVVVACGAAPASLPIQPSHPTESPAAASPPEGKRAGEPVSTALRRPVAPIKTGGSAVIPPKQVIPSDWLEHRVPNPQGSPAYKWVDVVLEVTGREVEGIGARPTIISRQMAVPLTAMYDAWAAYDEKAV